MSKFAKFTLTKFVLPTDTTSEEFCTAYYFLHGSLEGKFQWLSHVIPFYLNEKDLSLLHVQYKQDIIYIMEDLVACLCTGLSLLNIPEYIYFFSLRWGLQLCRERKQAIYRS